ncbi:hypothetical protein N3K66_003013 [Trichothecium roseum]|uniref:Uncharacterized protein n=1 Tax=Trichothecium roseum TaxID=47278 RepID=A0ACC0V477_9HYPO|nr:hypothetical protein N3K66_003013 [Trichothecium roseum]
MRFSIFATLGLVALVAAAPHPAGGHVEAEVIAKRVPDHDAGHVEAAGNVKRQAQRPPVGAPAMTDGSGNVVPFNSEALSNNKRKLKARKA